MTQTFTTFQEFKKRYPIQFAEKGTWLGSGTYGKVFRVEDQVETEWVAVKISEYRQNDTKSLKAEVELAQKVPRHANIARYDACYRLETDTGISDFAVMKYYSDGNLADLLKRSKLTDKELRDIVRGTLEGLKHLHQQRIVHRDFKPANILISRDNSGRFIPKIADFGLSKLVSQDEIDSSDFDLSDGRGTPSYKAPEQIEGGRVSFNLDLWAFGVILYEMLTGEKPFSVGTQSSEPTLRREIERKITSAQLPDRLRTLAEPYQGMIRRCLVKDIRQRVRKADELLALLDEPIKPPPPPKPVEKPSVTLTDHTDVYVKPKRVVQETKRDVYVPKAIVQTPEIQPKSKNTWLWGLIGGATVVLLGIWLRPKEKVEFEQAAKIWDKTLGGSGSDWPADLIATTDDGFVIVGGSVSTLSGDKSENNKGKNDYWVVKQNSAGQKIWDRTLGGSGEDYASAIVATIDGGFVIAGMSNSPLSGDKSENSEGGQDYWVIKLNSNGQKVWDKTIGGDSYDGYPTIVATADEGFAIAGRSKSNISGDKSENSRGENDYWVVKLNSNGQKVWDKTIGGSGYDNISAIVAADDGGFVIGGTSDSNISGDKSEGSKGGEDYWVVKLNSNGQKVWDKTFGGNDRDRSNCIIVTDDGGLLISGASNSINSGDKSEGSKGGEDYWVVRLNSSGQKVWDKTFGGNLEDNADAVVAVNDGSFVVGGTSNSNTSGDKSENSRGGEDYWVVKINSNGQKIWEKTLGGAGSDNVATIIATADGSFVIAGGSYSPISGDKSENSRGGSDYWVVKVK